MLPISANIAITYLQKLKTADFTNKGFSVNFKLLQWFWMKNERALQMDMN